MDGKKEAWADYDFYQRLGVSRDADIEAIEIAYAKMALKYHPDVAGDSPLVQERFAGINEAYSVLTDSARRKEYDAGLTTPEVVPEEEVVSVDKAAAEPASDRTPRTAERKARPVRKSRPGAPATMTKKRLAAIKREAGKLMNKGDFWGATRMLKKAADSFPRDVDLRKLLARAAEGRGRLREAVEELKIAAEVEYFNPEIHYLIGNLYLRGNQLEKASQAFRDALSWQEDYEKAREGLEAVRAVKNKNLPWWKKLFAGR